MNKDSMNKYSDKFLTSDYSYHTVYRDPAFNPLPFVDRVTTQYAISTNNGALPVRTVAASSPANALIKYVGELTVPDNQDGKTFFVREIATGAVWKLKAHVSKPVTRRITTTAA